MQAITAKLLVLGMGGTIAGRSQVPGDNVGYRAGEVAVEALLPSATSELARLHGCQIETLQIAQIDSKDMDHAVWSALADAVLAAYSDPAVVGIVITHGTDTLEETAFFLAQLCQPPKPVVLTCAMRPATSSSPDGPQNVLDAVCVAMDNDAVGVWVVANGAVHTAATLMKVHPYRTDAFSSGEAGPVAVVEEGRVRWFRSGCALPVPTGRSSGVNGAAPLTASVVEARRFLVALRSKGLPRVECLDSHAGVTSAAVDAWLAASSRHDPLRGLVLVCTGNGTFHRNLVEPLRRAEAAGIKIWRSTRCTQGQIVLGSTSVNWPLATALDPVKARIALALAIAWQDSWGG